MSVRRGPQHSRLSLVGTPRQPSRQKADIPPADARTEQRLQRTVPTLRTRVSTPLLRLDKIVIGVDFGTTYTGVSWASTAGSNEKTLDDIQCIRDWPGRNRHADFSWKTPSCMSFERSEGAARSSWGYDVSPESMSYSWMKLLLDPGRTVQYDDFDLDESEGSGVLQRPSGIDAVGLCASYLCQVAKYAQSYLIRKYSAQTIAATPFEFWLTVPAVWSDKAKMDTLRAAQKAAAMANMESLADCNISLIREPEAAAIATIHAQMNGPAPGQFRAGDNVLVCDAGGGTVDLIAYQIIETAPRLEFEELVPGIGGKCGSTFIDREFIKWMKEQFGTAFTSLSWKKRGPRSKFMIEFESQKRDFGKSDDPEHYYDMQLLEMKDVQDSRHYEADSKSVKIYNADFERFFAPVISRVKDLISQQLDSVRRLRGNPDIKTIILVGGLGDSVYLYNVLSQWSKMSGIRLLCPEHPQAAVVKGAALSGLLKVRPSSRRARRHYGFCVGSPFDARHHHEDDMYIHPWYGDAWARNQMSWKLAKGDMISEETFIRKRLETIVEDPTEIESMAVYCCDLEKPPRHRRDNGVHRLLEIDLDLSGVDVSRFERKRVKGRVLRKIPIQYVIYFGRRQGVLCFSCTVNGLEVGTTSVTFDGDESVQNLDTCNVQ